MGRQRGDIIGSTGGGGGALGPRHPPFAPQSRVRGGEGSRFGRTSRGSPGKSVERAQGSGHWAVGIHMGSTPTLFSQSTRFPPSLPPNSLFSIISCPTPTMLCEKVWEINPVSPPFPSLSSPSNPPCCAALCSWAWRTLPCPGGRACDSSTPRWRRQHCP